ncbi:MAG: hypothetical protein AAF686_07525 [Pseudomonadota bacterium]
MKSPSHRPVTRRRVFYVPGFDPLPPRRYRELYRKEAAAQSAISGYQIQLAALTTVKGGFGWQVEAVIDGQKTITEVDVLTWSDIVRESMATGVVATYAQLARTAWIYIRSGALARLMRLRKGPVLAALYPVIFLLGQLAVAIAAGWGVMALLSQISESMAASVVATLCGSVVAIGFLRWFRSRDGRFYAYYLMHDYAFSASAQGAYPDVLEARLAQFADRIRRALAEDFDEVLVVGHSSGAHLAISVLADILRASPSWRDETPARTPALSLLTLGQVVPMVSFLPQAHRLRSDLATLSGTHALTWVDVSAPGDGCCFALCDPVCVSGVAGPDKAAPLVLSAAFSQTLSAARWKDIRWRFFRLHFQYICAFDQPRDYDYFQITAGPMTLAQRYVNRRPSPSRIERALSAYTSQVAP